MDKIMGVRLVVGKLEDGSIVVREMEGRKVVWQEFAASEAYALAVVQARLAWRWSV